LKTHVRSAGEVRSQFMDRSQKKPMTIHGVITANKIAETAGPGTRTSMTETRRLEKGKFGKMLRILI